MLQGVFLAAVDDRHRAPELLILLCHLFFGDLEGQVLLPVEGEPVLDLPIEHPVALRERAPVRARQVGLVQPVVQLLPARRDLPHEVQVGPLPLRIVGL